MVGKFLTDAVTALNATSKKTQAGRKLYKKNKKALEKLRSWLAAPQDPPVLSQVQKAQVLPGGQPNSFLGLHREIRDMIYMELLLSSVPFGEYKDPFYVAKEERAEYREDVIIVDLNILRVCKQVHQEAIWVLYFNNFVIAPKASTIKFDCGREMNLANQAQVKCQLARELTRIPSKHRENIRYLTIRSSTRPGTTLPNLSWVRPFLIGLFPKLAVADFSFCILLDVNDEDGDLYLDILQLPGSDEEDRWIRYAQDLRELEQVFTQGPAAQPEILCTLFSFEGLTWFSRQRGHDVPDQPPPSLFEEYTSEVHSDVLFAFEMWTDRQLAMLEKVGVISRSQATRFRMQLGREKENTRWPTVIEDLDWEDSDSDWNDDEEFPHGLDHDNDDPFGSLFVPDHNRYYPGFGGSIGGAEYQFGRD